VGQDRFSGDQSSCNLEGKAREPDKRWEERKRRSSLHLGGGGSKGGNRCDKGKQKQTCISTSQKSSEKTQDGKRLKKRRLQPTRDTPTTKKAREARAQRKETQSALFRNYGISGCPGGKERPNRLQLVRARRPGQDNHCKKINNHCWGRVTD